MLSNFIDFDSKGDLKIKHRTNIQIELFHSLLNKAIESNHPKISFLNILLLIINSPTTIIMKNTIFFKFTVDFSKRYNKRFNFNFIIQDNENLLKILN